jgi:hypothetical protein
MRRVVPATAAQLMMPARNAPGVCIRGPVFNAAGAAVRALTLCVRRGPEPLARDVPP